MLYAISVISKKLGRLEFLSAQSEQHLFQEDKEVGDPARARLALSIAVG